MSLSRLIVVFAALAPALLALGAAGCDEPPQEQEQTPARQADEQSARDEPRVDADAIVETLEREEVSEQARLDAIHAARDGNIEAAIPALRSLLESPNPDVVVASAAALEGLEAEDAAVDVVEAASRLSRAQKFEHLRQLLYIIGEFDAPEARVYLETVADGHQVPGIQLTADEVLDRKKTN